MSVCLLLIISLIHNLPARSINSLLAFPQADLDTPVYMEMFPGISVPVMEGKSIFVLKKSFYGLKQVCYNWFEKLKAALNDRGFNLSEIDPCVFIYKDMIVLVYVDDCTLLAKQDSTIDHFISSLAQKDANGK